MATLGRILLILIVLAALMFGFFCLCLDRSFPGPPSYFPNDWHEYVWISEEPKAFITESRPTEKSIGFLGGQMEIDGEIQTVDFTYRDPGNYGIFAERTTYTVSRETGHYTCSKERGIVFSSSTKYRKERIICKGDKKSEYYAGQEIVFVKYDRDEVPPADFGFDLESWDDFVTVVDSLPSDDDPEPERKPAPTPIPEEYSDPTPVPIATPSPEPAPQYALVSADARPARQKTAICHAPS